MPAQIFGADAAVVTLNRAFNDQSPSNAVFLNQKSAAGTTQQSFEAFALQFGAGFQGKTDAELSKLLMTNLGLLPNADLESALTAYITSVGKVNIGVVALQLGQILSGLEFATGAQAIYNAPAVAWNNEVTASYNYSANPANTSAGPVGPDDTATTGVTVILTTAADFIAPNASEAKYKTTANNDTIVATTTGTLNDGDTLDGGAGKDTLNVLVTDAATVKAASIANIEIINVNLPAASLATTTFDATNVTAAQQIWAVGAGTTDADAVKFTNVDKSYVVGVKGAGSAGAVATTVVYKATQVAGLTDEVTLAFGGTGAAGGSVAADDVEIVNVQSITGANVGTLTGNAIETVKITGDKGLTLDLSGLTATLKTVDGSTGTAAQTVTTGAIAQASTIKTGTSADTVNLTGAAAKATVDTGAGNDTVVLTGTKAHAITLGAGTDTLQVNLAAGALNNSTAGTLATGAVTVADFVSGTDKVSLTGATILTLTGTEQTVVSATSDLKAALASAFGAAGAAGITLAAQAVSFSFGADSYVFFNNGGTANAIDATDTLIKLTGVASLAASDVVAG